MKNKKELKVWTGHYIQKPATFTYIIEEVIEEALIESTKERCTAIAIKQGKLRKEGREFLLPSRISIMDDGLAKVKNQGRGRRQRIRQLKGRFLSVEDSRLKVYKPYVISTSIWKCEGFSNLCYGTLGISNSEGRIDEDNGDLLVLYTEDWKEVWVYVFKGMAFPNEIASNQEIFQYAEMLVADMKKGASPKQAPYELNVRR